MTDIQELERTGWIVSCPICGAGIRYTSLTNQRPPTPFFYAELGNDVLLREQDGLLVDTLFAGTSGGTPGLHALEGLWVSILADSPQAPRGGRFGMWAYIDCPHCGETLPYDHGRKDLSRRIHEPKVVLVDDAILVEDSPEDSWRIKVKVREAP